MRYSQGCYISVAQSIQHSQFSDEWRVSNYKIRPWPFSLSRVHIAIHESARRIVGNILTGDRVLLERLPVPATHRLTVGIEHRLLAVVFENGVPALDVVERLDDRLCGHSRAEGAEVPLKVTNPEHELGNGGGAGIDLDAEELVRVNGVTGSLENRLCFAQAVEHIADFPL